MVIRFDLGNFLVTTGKPKLLTLPNGTEFVREAIMIESDGIKAERYTVLTSTYLVHFAVSFSLSSATDDAPWELLPSVKFNVRVVRNLLDKPENDMPLFDVLLNMKAVKVRTCVDEIVDVCICCLFVCFFACLVKSVSVIVGEVDESSYSFCVSC